EVGFSRNSLPTDLNGVSLYHGHALDGKDGIRVQRVCPGPKFRIIAHPVLVRISIGINTDVSKMSDLPVIGDSNSSTVGGDFANTIIGGIGNIYVVVGVRAYSRRAV